MAYSDFGPPRRSRRRRNVVVFIVLLLVVGVLTLAVRYRTERRESIDYLATAGEVAAQHATMADQLGMLLQGLGEEERPEVIERLETLATEARDARRRLESMVVTRPVAKVAGLMTVAVGAWEDAIRELDDAIVAVLDADVGDISGDDALREAFSDLEVGDRAFADVAGEVARLHPDIVSVAFPTISYTGGEFAPLYDAAVIADRLRRLGTLSELLDVALTATTVPEPVSEGAGGIWAIPASDGFAVDVTVSNTGNVTAEKISVVVTLQKAASGDDIAPLGQLITSLDPQESTQLLFDNLEVELGQVYTITASATLEGGPDATDDNTWTLVFERNAE